MLKEFEFKFDVLGWLQRRKEKKRKAEREELRRSRLLYRGQVLKMTGDAETNTNILLNELNNYDQLQNRT